MKMVKSNASFITSFNMHDLKQEKKNLNFTIKTQEQISNLGIILQHYIIVQRYIILQR
jgi:hypothetical protein